MKDCSTCIEFMCGSSGTDNVSECCGPDRIVNAAVVDDSELAVVDDSCKTFVESIDHLIAALRIIKNECNNHSNCTLCPFGTNDHVCVLHQKRPSKWHILEPTDVIRVVR